MMNERGFISLTAIFMMFLLSITIVGVLNMAMNQADITRYYKVETKLQNAAESVFNEFVYNLSINDKYYGEAIYDGWVHNFNSSANDIPVKVYIKTNNNKIAIMAVAEISNYRYGLQPVYKRVYGYMEKTSVESDDNENAEEYHYEFKEYLE